MSRSRPAKRRATVAPMAGRAEGLGRGRLPAGVSVGIVALVALGLGAAVGWSGHTVFAPPEPGPPPPTHALVEVAPGAVGSSVNLNVVAEWHPAPAGVNRAAGVVTSVAVEDGTLVRPGDVLYTVALKPVVAAPGSIPAFRDLAEGASGEDVRQLERFLVALKHLRGRADTEFKADTTRAVKAWQKSLRVAQTGVVRGGDLVYVDSLPARLALDREVIAVGGSLTGGERAILSLGAAPEFSLPVTAEQAGLMPPGTEVRVSAPEGRQWMAVTGSQQPTEQGIRISVESVGGGPVCGSDCGAIAVGDRSLLRSVVVTVPETSGLVVPAAAVRTTNRAEAVVIDENGAQHRVEVRASGRGLTVIAGVEPGLRVRVPAS